MRRKELFFQRIVIIAISFAAGFFVIFFTSATPFQTIRSFLSVPFSNRYFFGNLLTLMIPFIFTGLAASISFQTNEFNLGIEGQCYFSTLIGTWVALEMGSLFPVLAIPIIILASAFSGGFFAFISAFLKSKYGVNELISSLLIGYSLLYVTDYFLEGPMLDRQAGLITTKTINEALVFPKILQPSQLNTGIFLGIILIIIFYFVLRKSVFGLKMTLYGQNTKFSEYIGIKGKKVIHRTFFLSGAMAGMAGIVDVLGVHGKMIRGFSFGYGWTGIAVALIAKNNPLWILPAAFLFAFLESAASASSIFSDMTPEISKIIQAGIFFLVTVSFFRGSKQEKQAT
ncbi:MAG: ABC transporter permease [Thermotogota bacterium]